MDKVEILTFVALKQDDDWPKIATPQVEKLPFDRKAYQREYMRAYRKRNASKATA